MSISRRYNAQIILLLISICISQSAVAKKRLAILEFRGQVGLSTDELMYLSDQVRAEAQSLLGERFIIMTREVMSELTDSPEMLEACESGCEVNVGRALQAHWLVSGKIFGDDTRLQASIKLHEVKKGVSIDIEFAEGETLKELVTDARESSGRLLSHLMIADEEEQFAQINLPSATLPESFQLSASDTLGLPLPLLKQYDQALLIDEDKTANIETKLETWSKLSRYKQYQKLRAETSRRLRYWRQRFKRRVQCNDTWKQLEQLLALRRAISSQKKQQLVESFLEACGREPHENPHLNAPYFVNQRRETKLRGAKAEMARLKKERAKLLRLAKEKKSKEEQALRLKKERQAARKRNEEEYSLLETHVGASYQLNAGSISSYHLRFRLQPQAWWARQVFLEGETSFARVNSVTRREATWSGEWATALGLQWLNSTEWIPSLSTGYQLRSGEQRLLTELALRYRPIPEWLNIHLGVQYLRLLSSGEPRVPVQGSLPKVSFLEGAKDEVRLTLWASTGMMGLSLILLGLYAISQL